tara:strand:+ start:126 stop:698 length:573 start_codon:yes stop_codon:yes gene_type:complete
MLLKNKCAAYINKVLIVTLFGVSLAMASEKPFESFDPKNSRSWSFFTDGVMGGVSSGKAFLGKSGSDNFVRLEGDVSTANNGGFIQIRHSLEKYLDKDVRGISLKVRGNGEKYYVFIRTSSTLLPWQFYNASFNTSKNWKLVKINLEEFQPSSSFLRKTLKSSSIKSIGIVAYGRDHKAKVDVSEIYFFK